ncbi:MAG: hypothetical protein EBV10_09310 [Synechococcaceae bacterium WB6_1A_059]|nr:hypothetical protein [Synechococcaceae bacterium WB6_1A_059]
MNDFLVTLYLICFAAIAGGAFALMNQNLRNAAAVPVRISSNSKQRVHPEAPAPGDEVMYVDLSRERLEALYQQAAKD